MSEVTRRVFLASGPVGVLGVGALGATHGLRLEPDGATVSESYPITPAERAQAIVGASHVRLERVKALLSEDAGLARASWDWGFGDWETAIGAASHTGRKDIIELLVAHGARPTLFTLATLDEVDAVRAVIEHAPGADALEGPHSISLYDHARAGQATRVMEYLESRGLKAPDPFATDRARGEPYLGTYAWGPGADERFEVAWFERRSAITLERAGGVSRMLIHRDGHEFSPAGARHARVRFEVGAGVAERVVVEWAGSVVVGTRL
ncbi:MAG: hypothetical protein ACIARR_13040 [Phycisphaerales bacterium JB059]